MVSYKNIVETKERKRKHPLRKMTNAMLYLTKTACQWQMLLKEFGPWQTIYFYFRKWKLERVFEELMHHLRESVRKAFGKAISPIDFRTIRTSHHIDTLGIIPVVVIHTANILRPDAAKSSQYHPKDGLWTELFHGSKVLEGSVKTTKYFQKLHKP